MSYRRKQEDKRRALQLMDTTGRHCYYGVWIREDGAIIKWSRSDCWNTKDFKRRAAKAVRKADCSSGKMYRKIHDWYHYY